MKLLTRLCSKGSDILFIFSITIFQLLFIFQGLDFTDQGTYATLYQQIFSAPESVQTFFIYWLTAIIGGGWIKLFPDLGLLGIRLAGVLTTTALVIIVYGELKKYLSINNLRYGICIAILLIYHQSPPDLNYNNLSTLFWAIGSLLIFSGLKKENLFYLFIGGFVFGLNVFTRIPNILGGVILVAVFYYGWLVNKSIKSQFKEAGVILLGFLIAISIVILIMSLVGHLDLFLGSLSQTQDWAGSQEDPHNLFRMIMKMITQIFNAISYAGFFMTVSVVYIFGFQFITNKNKKYASHETYFNFIFLLIVMIIMLLLAVKGIFDGLIPVLFVVGVALLTNIFIILNSGYKPEMRLLSFLGVVMLIILPCGSAWGFFHLGKYALLISLPIGIEFLSEFRNVKISYSFFKDVSEKNIIIDNQMKIFSRLFIYICMITGVYLILTGSPYFDHGDRERMHYTIHHNKLRGILTTKERAKVVQELLIASSYYVKPGDYVFAYADIPMYHYLTDTKSYLRNPWPGLYTSEMFGVELKNSLQRTEYLPVVVLQKVNTVNTDWPGIGSKSLSNEMLNEKRAGLFNDFIKRYNYKVVWENDAFLILKPDI